MLLRAPGSGGQQATPVEQEQLPTVAVGTLWQTEYTIEKPLPAVNAAGRDFLYEKFQISTSNRPIISGMVKIDKSVLRTYSALECAASRLYS